VGGRGKVSIQQQRGNQWIPAGRLSLLVRVCEDGKHSDINSPRVALVEGKCPRNVPTRSFRRFFAVCHDVILWNAIEYPPILFPFILHVSSYIVHTFGVFGPSRSALYHEEENKRSLKESCQVVLRGSGDAFSWVLWAKSYVFSRYCLNFTSLHCFLFTPFARSFQDR
jgi:hypothetical protein